APARRIDRDLPAAENLKPILELEPALAARPTEERGRKRGRRILQRKISVAGRRRPVIADFALNPDLREGRLEHSPNRLSDLADRQMLRALGDDWHANRSRLDYTRALRLDLKHRRKQRQPFQIFGHTSGRQRHCDAVFWAEGAGFSKAASFL